MMRISGCKLPPGSMVPSIRVPLLSSRNLSCVIVTLLFLVCNLASAQRLFYDSSSHYLRVGEKPEWDEFANRITKKQLDLRFTANDISNLSLSFVQYDVKQDWNIFLNDEQVGSLATDANKMQVYFELPSKGLKTGENFLKIVSAKEVPDDIVIGDIIIDSRPVDSLLNESVLEMEVIDEKTSKNIPSRITIVNNEGTLQSTGTIATERVAVRPGFIYTGDGRVTITVPHGRYTVYAGRGFEYSVDSVTVDLRRGERLQRQLSIRHEVETPGWISSDTHIHTLTHSGHGDATSTERLLTIAGEGIELPIVTEHNRVVDLRALAKNLELDSFFTIVPGDEVTTAIGHFNVFPFSNGTPPAHTAKNWNELSKELPAKENRVIILNHARDIHNQFRPFDPKHHVPVAGHNLDGWTLPANAMEIVNSGALQHDAMRLVIDWFGMMNHGHSLTPIGASDSHDVSRYLVGQARTYVKGEDRVAGRINVEEVSRNFREGKVIVNFGLLPKITVNKKYGPGEIALYSRNTTVKIEVAGPHWIQANRISLYANGRKIRQQEITEKNTGGIKWQGEWILPPQKQDVFLVAIAEGTGDHLPYWPIVKPFQPVTASWKPYSFGLSGAIWIDGDMDGKITPAIGYAKILVKRFARNRDRLLKELSGYDEAVAVQVALLLHQAGTNLLAADFTNALSRAARPVQVGFVKFVNAMKESKRYK